MAADRERARARSGMEDVEEFPWATAMMAVVFLVIVVVGGAVVIWGDNDALTSRQYFRDLALLAIGIGLLGVGRGVRSGLRRYLTHVT